MTLTEIDTGIRVSKFKVGDRVRVYDVCRVSWQATWDNGTVEEFTMDGLLRVKCDHWKSYQHNYFHPKQCRKLKPKHKKVPREIWLIEYSDGQLDDCCFRVDPTKDTTRKYVRFIEAKEK